MVTPMVPVDGATVNSVDSVQASALIEPSIDFEAAAKLAIWLVKQGSDALVLSGTTGEAPVTHIEEKEELICAIRLALSTAFPEKHIPLIAGTGSNDTGHAIRNTISAEKAGADAVLVVTPYYSRPSQAGILAHYEAVAKATKLPVILYDVPGRSGVTIAPETYAELAKIRNVVAIKDATGNVYRAGKILEECNAIRAKLGLEEMTLYAGDDSLFLPFLSVGAKGIISVASHLVSSEFSSALKAWNEGDKASARKAFNEAVWAIDLLNGDGQQAGYTKSALTSLGVIPNNTMRLPNVPPDEEKLAEIARICNDKKFVV